jgi:hypothetical protein
MGKATMTKVKKEYSVTKKAKTVKEVEEPVVDSKPLNIHLYTSLLAENKTLRLQVEELKNKLEDAKAAVSRLKFSRADVLEKVGLKDRIKNLFF